MVGRMPLEHAIGVRIPARQPFDSLCSLMAIALSCPEGLSVIYYVYILLEANVLSDECKRGVERNNNAIHRIHSSFFG